ncbi:hypothetical protein GBAR_LOCUS5500, partial [Geodia barretti]
MKFLLLAISLASVTAAASAQNSGNSLEEQCPQFEFLRGRDGRDGRDGEKGEKGDAIFSGEQGPEGPSGLAGPRGP